MNDVAIATSISEVAERPERKTIVVNAYRVRTGRIELMEVSWSEYVALHDAGFLKYQIEKTRKPDHLPDCALAAYWAGVTSEPPPVQAIDPQELAKPTVAETTIDTVAPSEELEASTLERRRRKPAEKLKVLEETSVELRADTPQLLASDLLKAAAQKLRMTETGLSRFYYHTVPEDVRIRLLCGEGGRKVTRSERKFNIIMRVRQEMREQGLPQPRKKELIDASYKRLDMKRSSVSTYVYDRLNDAEVEALDLRGQYFTREEQIVILKEVRQEMRDKGLPRPRQIDLARATAQQLKQKVGSVRSLIAGLDQVTRDAFEFSASRSGMLLIHDPQVVREGVVGAIAVLKLRRLPLKVSALAQVLKIKPYLIERYLDDHPDIKVLLVDEK